MYVVAALGKEKIDPPYGGVKKGKIHKKQPPPNTLGRIPNDRSRKKVNETAGSGAFIGAQARARQKAPAWPFTYVKPAGVSSSFTNLCHVRAPKALFLRTLERI